MNNKVSEACISRLKVSNRVNDRFKTLIMARLSRGAASDNEHFSLNENENSQTDILLKDENSGLKLSKMIGAQIHVSALRQLITKAELEAIEKWLGLNVFRFALRGSYPVPQNLMIRKAGQPLSEAIQNDGAAILSRWVAKQNSGVRAKIELMHGDILTVLDAHSEVTKKISDVLGDNLVKQAIESYDK